jgi:resolvase-like protein
MRWCAGLGWAGTWTGLTRSPRELEEVIDPHDKRGIVLATVTGEMDLSTPTGRMLARMLGAVARHEAEGPAAETWARVTPWPAPGSLCADLSFAVEGYAVAAHRRRSAQWTKPP